MSNKINKSSVLSSLFWKFMERGESQGIQFVMQIILARLLFPEDYGIIALVTIFISLASVFVQSGLNTALIQKNAKVSDFRKVFPSHLDFIYNSDKENIYYDVFSIRPKTKDFVKKYLIKIVGINLFRKFVGVRNKFILTLQRNPR